MVNAHVDSGGGACHDNQWALTISAGQINGVDGVDKTMTLSFVRLR